MNQLVELVRQFFRLFKLWVIVSPWEQALRVRLGKHVSLLDAGIHLRIPVIDLVFLQSTRMRLIGTDRQTVGTADHKTASFAAALGYEICDLELLYRTLHHAEDTLRNLIRSSVARDISTHKADELDPVSLADRVSKSLDLEEYGLSGGRVFITDLLVAKTYRLVGDYSANYQSGTSLNTEAMAASKAGA